MIVLDTTTLSLRAVLAGAKATNDAQCYVTYYDVPAQTKMGNEEYRRGANVQNTNGTTAVTVCPAPTVGNVSRCIEYVSVHNYDTAAVIVTLYVYNSTGTVTTRLVKQTLAAGETMLYEHEGGWQVL